LITPSAHHLASSGIGSARLQRVAPRGWPISGLRLPRRLAQISRCQHPSVTTICDVMRFVLSRGGEGCIVVRPTWRYV